MGLLSPWFLGGLLAASLPLYLHLLRQHKSIPRPFSSLMFFERRTQSSIKHRRLRYLALLALRLAMLVLLALLFANPFIRRSPSASGDGRRLLILAVDNSFSMRAAGRLERAKQEAMSAASGFRSGDRGQVLTFDSRAAFATQQVEDGSTLRAAIQGIQPGDGRSAYGELCRALRSIAQTSRLPLEVHVFTDAQRTSLPSPFSELALAGNTRLVLHAVADKREPNWFVESVQAPQSVYQARKVRIQATVAGAGTAAGETVATLALNGKTIESKKLSIPANGRASAEFFLNDAPYGLNRGEVRIESRDKLSGDDRFFFAIERKEAGRVLFVHEARQARAALYYRAAMGSAVNSAFTVDAVTPEQTANLAPEKYSFVVLSDAGSLPPAFEDALRKHVRAGGAVFIALGPASAARQKLPVTGDAILESRYASRTGERFQAAASVDAAHPALANTNGLDGIRFYQTIAFDAGQGRVLARLTDQSPLVTEKKLGEGRILIFASTFDNISNDFPLHTSFVPFVERTANYLGGIEQTSADYAVDTFLELRSGRGQGSAVEVIGPDGKRALSLRDSASAQAFRLEREGYYEVRRAIGRHELVAVHADRRESDLDVIPAETLALWQSAGRTRSGPGAGDSEPKPYSLWWYFALALLALAVVESLVASRYMQVETDAEEVTRKAAA